MKRLSWILVAWGFFVLPTYGAIHQVKHIMEAIRTVDPNTLLIFDLDNTVMESSQMLGSDQWYGYLVRAYQERGLTKEDAVDRAIAQWIVIQRTSEMQPVERATPTLIRAMQQSNVRVMALTARPTQLEKRTLTQLKKIGVSFMLHPVHRTEVSLPFKNGTAKYSQGVLFVGAKLNKGVVLGAFLKKISLKPKRVAFVDDKLKHVKDVGQALSKMKVAYTGFRYGATDAKVKAFDPWVAAVQFRYFRKILPDEAARRIRAAE